MIKFILITKTQTSLNGGRVQIDVDRQILKLDGNLTEFAKAYLKISDMQMFSFTQMNENRTIIIDLTDNDETSLGYSFTELSAGELPFYAKTLAAKELQAFLEHANEQGIIFKDQDAAI